MPASGADVRQVALCGLVALAYFVGAEIGFALTISPQPIATLWPPNAILLTAFLLIPRGQWWLLILLAFAAHLLAQLGAGVPMPMLLSWFATNLCEALVGAVSIQYVLGAPPDFGKLRDTCVFLLCGVCLAPFVASFLDIAAVKALDWGQGGFWQLCGTRLLSNALAMLVLVPAILTTIRRRSFRSSIAAPWRRAEAVLLGGAMLAVCLIAFTDGNIDERLSSVILFAVLPLLLWAAMRFGAGYVSYLVLALTLAAVWAAQHWLGPFIQGSAADNVLVMQSCLLLVVTPILLLTAVISEWRSAQISLLNRKQQLLLAMHAAHVDTWRWDLRSDRLTWSGNALTGFAEYDAHIDLPVFFRQVHPDDRASIEAALIDAGQRRHAVRTRTADAAPRPELWLVRQPWRAAAGCGRAVALHRRRQCRHQQAQARNRADPAAAQRAGASEPGGDAG